MKSMKLSQYFQVIKPKYIYLKLIPDTSIRNYNSSNIAKSISHMYKNIFQLIKREEKKLTFETQVKCSYLVDIRKTSIDFYFIVPIQHSNIVIEKIREVWPKVTIEEVDHIEEFTSSSLRYQLYFKREDALSLNVDRKSNEPLNSLLNVIDIMKEDDRIGIFYNFMPCSQLPWQKYYNGTIQKVKMKVPVEREKLSLKYVALMGLTYFMQLIDGIIDVLCDFTGGAKKKNEQLDFLEIAAEALNTNINKLSTSTLKKKDAVILNTQIMVLSESQDATRQSNNALAVCQAYKSIEEDNELIFKKVNAKNVFHVNDFKIAGAEESYFSVDECSNFIQLPGRELLFQHKIIGQINTLETDVPKELKQGTKLIGSVTYRGQEVKAHLTTDKDYKNLAVAVIGPTRSGKTSLLGNLSRNSVDDGECVIVLDYIENCELSNSIKECIPKNKVLELDLCDYTNLQGLGYNEAFIETDDPFRQYESAKKQTSQVTALINSINVDNSEFTPKMGKYLTAASLIVFINNGPIRDVFQVLQDHIERNKYINIIPDCQKENLKEYVMSLNELDEWSKATKDNPSELIGTHLSYVSGIIDRADKLKSNTYMEFMLKKDCTNNFNLLEEMEKNQVIFIKMPEAMFGTPEERDVMTTYWLTKIWMAAQARAWKITDRYQRKTVTVITDEIAQLKAAEQFMGSKLDQTAKFAVKFILSTMYINQLRIRDKLRTANTSYILIAGADKTNFKELREEFEQFGYSLEDLMNLKRYHSLNYIKYEKGYAAFITKLPLPIK